MTGGGGIAAYRHKRGHPLEGEETEEAGAILSRDLTLLRYRWFVAPFQRIRLVKPAVMVVLSGMALCVEAIVAAGDGRGVAGPFFDFRLTVLLRIVFFIIAQLGRRAYCLQRFGGHGAGVKRAGGQWRRVMAGRAVFVLAGRSHSPQAGSHNKRGGAEEWEGGKGGALRCMTGSRAEGIMWVGERMELRLTPAGYFVCPIHDAV